MRPIRLSNRLPGDFTPTEMARRLEQARRSGRDILDLSVSNPSAAGLSASDEELKTALASERLGAYEPHPRGMPSARAAICRRLAEAGIDLNPEHVWLTSGTSEAYGFLFRLLGNPGDEVLVPTPSYPLFEHLLKLEGLTPVAFPLVYDRGWSIDFEALEARTGTQTRAIVVVHPNNPTGSYLSDDEAKRLLAFCAEKGLALIADEVFLTYAWDDRRRFSFHSAKPVCPLFVLNGLSKHFGLPQLKLSWIHAQAPEKIFPEIADGLDWISDGYLSVSAPVQRGIEPILKLGDELHGRILSRVRNNVETLRRSIPKKMEDHSGDGGWNAILRLPDSVDEENLVIGLLRKSGVLVQPGYLFDLPFKSSVVLSLLPACNDFRTGIDALFQAVVDEV